MSTASDLWGRVADDGTVYVREADGEREVGSWQAGSPDEALAFFKRKFDALETEVRLLERRIANTDLAAAPARATITRLLAAVTDARAIGDLAALRARIEALSGVVDQRRAEQKTARDHVRGEAAAAKEKIVAEAEQIAATATQWKTSGERMTVLLTDWKGAPRGDKAVEAALWKRLSAARNAFTKRRRAYFAQLEEEREEVRARKEKLISEAEALASGTDWGATASAYRELMRSWKESGRADRTAEDALWDRFKAAQDGFFAARAEAMSAKDAHLREHAVVKEQLLAEAGKLLPVTDGRSARSALRGIQERWEQAGPAPRDAQERLEGGLRRVEEAVRKAEDAHWRRASPEALARARDTVDKLRTTISQLEAKQAKAAGRGDDKGRQDAADALTARRAWLTEAERTLTELSL